MKKILRRIVVLVLVATLIIIPSSTAFAASAPYLAFELPQIGYRFYEFTPDAIEFNDGSSTALYDPSTSNQTIYVPAGKSCTLDITVDKNSTLQVTIFGQGYFYNQIITNPDSMLIRITIPADIMNHNYSVWLNTVYTATTIYSYSTTIN